MPSTGKDFRVAVVGGGMCGLLCAIGLVKAGVRVEVFEQASKFEEVGAGVGLGPNALIPLKQLGVLEAVLSRAEEPVPTMRSFRFISAEGAHEYIYDYPSVPNDAGLGIYRNVPAFLEAVAPMLDPHIIHFKRRCVSISTSPSGTHVLKFSDGSTYDADVVIGADGIKSVIREFVSGQSTGLAYSNSVAYRSVIPMDDLINAGIKTDITRTLCWVGKNKHIISYPIQAKRLMNVVFFSTDCSVPIGSVDVPPPWAHAVSYEELLQEYSGWGEDALALLKHMKNPSKWHLHFLQPPLSSYVRQRVVLVGDAAHAMLPHLGAGVGQGFEDVYALCALLGDAQAQKRDINAALKAYDAIRVPRANMVHRMTTIAGDIYEGRGKGGAAISQIRDQLKGLWEPVWHHDLKEEVKRAVSRVYGGKGVL